MTSTQADTFTTTMTNSIRNTVNAFLLNPNATRSHEVTFSTKIMENYCVRDVLNKVQQSIKSYFENAENGGFGQFKTQNWRFQDGDWIMVFYFTNDGGWRYGSVLINYQLDNKCKAKITIYHWQVPPTFQPQSRMCWKCGKPTV